MFLSGFIAPKSNSSPPKANYFIFSIIALKLSLSLITYYFSLSAHKNINLESSFLALPFIYINALTFISSLKHITRLHSLTSKPSSMTLVAISKLISPVLNLSKASFNLVWVILR